MKKTALLACLSLAFLQTTNGQLSAKYPHDTGIENDPDVLFVEKFEDGLTNIFARYQDKKNTGGMSLDADVPPGSNDNFSLKMTNLGGSNSGGHLYKQFAPGWDSTVFVRYYVKYPSISQGFIHHESVWLGGYNPATPWPNPQAGTCGLGDKRISVAYEPIGSTNMNTYLYWGEMHHDPNGNCWGNTMIRGDWTPAPVAFDDWLCVEIMVKLNNPVNESNGELQIWHNGQSVGHWGAGFPNGDWVWDKFNVGSSGSPFGGFRWRTEPALNLNYLWIEYYDDQSPNGASHYIKYDHLVVAKKYIGPINIASQSSDVLPAPLPFFTIFPNPATNKFTVRVKSEVGFERKIEVVNWQGQVVKTQILAAGEKVSEFDLGNVVAGIYVVRLADESRATVQKVIIR